METQGGWKKLCPIYLPTFHPSNLPTDMDIKNINLIWIVCLGVGRFGTNPNTLHTAAAIAKWAAGIRFGLLGGLGVRFVFTR